MLLPETRTASPWICDLTFGNSSRISFVRLFARSSGSPRRSPISWRTLLPPAGSTLPQSKILSDRLRRTAFDSIRSLTAAARYSSSVSSVISSLPWVSSTVDALEVEALLDLAPHLVERVAQLLLVEVAHDVERDLPAIGLLLPARQYPGSAGLAATPAVRAAARRSGSCGRRPSRARRPRSGPRRPATRRSPRRSRARRRGSPASRPRRPRRARPPTRWSCRGRGPPRCRRSRRRRPRRGRRRRRRAAPRSGGRSAARRRPTPAGPARAGGRRRASRGSPSGGGRSRRRRSRRPPRPSARAGVRRRRTTRAPASTASGARSSASVPPRRRRAHSRRCGGRPSPGGRCGGSRGAHGRNSSTVVPSGRPRRSARAATGTGSAAVGELLGEPAREAVEPLRANVEHRGHDRGARPEPTSRRTSSATPGSPTLATSVGRTRALPAAADRIHASRRRSRRQVGEHVRVVPLDGCQHGHGRAGTGRSCRRTRPPPRRTASPAPAGRWPARRRSATRAAAPRRTPTDPRRPTTSACTSQPDGGALAVRPRDRDERPPARRVRDDLLPRLERDPRRARGGQLGVVGVDRRQRLGDGEPVRRGRPVDVRGGRAPTRAGSRRPRAPACTATARRGRSRSTTAPARWARSAAAHAPAPAAPTTWIRSPARIGRAARARREAGSRRRRTARHARHAPSRPRAAARARPRRCRACSPIGRRTTGSGAPRRPPGPATAT